ncbi:MAG: hypothetical protein HY808_01730 [Nitrospirae bacterium]|nr:hypothetical protein [Nitrospirota bacterium]
MNKRFRSIMFFLLILTGIIVPQFVIAATYYISPFGNNSNLGTQANPFATFSYAFAHMSGGDTLYVMDGTYNEQIKDMPSGTAGNYTKIYAVNDHKADIDGGGTLPSNIYDALLSIVGKSYVEMRGLKVHNSNGSVCRIEDSNNITLKVMGCWHGGGTYKHTKPVYVGTSSNVLLEDVWAFGRGRYTVHVGAGATNVVLRRVVTRWDAGAYASEPIAGFAIYKGQNTTIENGITFDHYTHGSISTEHRGFQINSWNTGEAEAINNKILGSIGVNLENATHGSFYNATEVDTQPDNNLFENNVAVEGRRGFALQSGTNITIRSCTSINNSDSGYRQNAKGADTYIANNLSYNNATGGYVNNSGSYQKFDYNGYNANNPAVSGFTKGEHDRTDNPQLLYPLRIESNSVYKNTGENGADIGANVIYKYENGVLTTKALWPWPYENWIKEDMCDASFLQQVGRTGADAPKWCTTNKTLTQYIWEYLGNTCPDEICNYTKLPPPQNLRIISQ